MVDPMFNGVAYKFGRLDAPRTSHLTSSARDLHWRSRDVEVPVVQSTTTDGKSSPNQALSALFESDQTFLSSINATLFDYALPYNIGKETARDAWEYLEHRYGSLSRSHVIKLKKCLQHVKKGYNAGISTSTYGHRRSTYDMRCSD
ncbi:hypothetical protein MRB53_016842 [Persea americana]|uniref:Uncharacterized protein n=1 Tax=Persea americana TaxID=3435 RepID=A0ACC2M3A6_PERAE|nr:hypothetical protein MRB53_016842 [Persea americana]